MDEVINRFQIRFNKTKVYEDALIECINNYSCKQNTGISEGGGWGGGGYRVSIRFDILVDVVDPVESTMFNRIRICTKLRHRLQRCFRRQR